MTATTATNPTTSPSAPKGVDVKKALAKVMARQRAKEQSAVLVGTVVATGADVEQATPGRVARSVAMTGRVIRGVWTAGPAFRAWRLATEFDSKIVALEASGDHPRAVVTLTAQLAEAEKRRARAARIAGEAGILAAPVIFGGWFWASTVLAVALIASLALLKVKAMHGKVVARIAEACGASVLLEAVLAAAGVRPAPLVLSDTQVKTLIAAPAVAFAVGVGLAVWGVASPKGILWLTGLAEAVALASCWHGLRAAWSMGYLAPPLLAVVPAFIYMIVWAIKATKDDGTISDNLRGATSIGAAVVAPRTHILEAVNAAVGVNGVTAGDWHTVQGLRKADEFSDDVVLQTPGRITTKQVVQALPRFAAIMGVQQSWVTIREEGAEGVVRITIANRDQWGDVREWPLIDVDRFSVWRPMPFAFAGTSTITVTLMFAGWLLAAVPRVGKTFALRLLVLAWLLDETTDVAVHDLKGGRDLLMAKPMCVAWGHGRSDDQILALRDYLKRVLEVDGPIRKAAFNALPSTIVPDGQLTEAAVHADARLRPLLIAVDEVHWATTHEEYGEEIVDLLSKIAKDLPYLGVELALASQRLDAKETMPTKLRNVLSNRIAMKLHSSPDSAMILGDAANRLGYNASELPKTRETKGVCILHGADDDSSIDGYLKAKTFLCDGLQAERVAARALANRQRAAVVPEQEPEEPVSPELLAVARIIRESGQPSMRSEEVATRLETTAQRLRDRTGVRARQCPEDAYRRHLYLEDVEAAIDGRMGTRPASLRVVG